MKDFNTRPTCRNFREGHNAKSAIRDIFFLLTFEPRRAKSRLPRCIGYRGFIPTSRDVFIGIVFSLLAFFSCERNTTPFTQTPAQLILSTEYVAVTEAWLQVQTENISTSQQLKILRDTTVVFNGILTKADTTIYDSTLLPAHDYTYYAAIVKNGNNLVESPPLKISTMDTTSHDISWEIFTFGTISNSLRDVAIINGSDIWAAGQMYMPDSTGNLILYNAVHWDGQQWELKRIPFIGSCSAVDYPPIRAIWAFSENNILFTNGGAIARYDGSATFLDCGMNSLLDGAISKIFATDPSNVYAVGGAGTIVRYYEGSWQKIESGTTIDLLDIWGSPDGSVVWVCGYNNGVGTVLLKIHNNKAEKVYDDSEHLGIIRADSLSGGLTSLWTNNARQIYIMSTAGMYIAPANTSGNARRIFDTSYPRRIRGTGINDIFVGGDFSLMAHYNGVTLRFYNDFAGNIRTWGIDMTDNLIVLAGRDGQSGSGVIIRGQR